MKHKSKYSGHKDGDIRIIKKFLLFPKCLNFEWRWLEKVEIVQRISVFNNGSFFYWYDEGWKDKIKNRS